MPAESHACMPGSATPPTPPRATLLLELAGREELLRRARLPRRTRPSVARQQEGVGGGHTPVSRAPTRGGPRAASGGVGWGLEVEDEEERV